LEIWVVSIWDAVSITIGVLSIIRVSRELVNVVCLAIAVGISIIRVCTHAVFLGVSQTITIRVTIGVTAVGGGEAVGHLPSIW
jgi:hypothetical protein